ncbi:MAG TPA: LAGLIDADG family homing endonuclease [Negativicutes bacterium]|nr:LAGLIDADG family homing endonuclease [Negativicutes bacterium]
MLSLDLRGGHNRYKFNKDFFKKWSPEMAHVLGFLYADGNITDSVASRAQYIHFYSTDRHILESIRATMASSHVIEVILPKTANHKNGTYKSKEGFKLRIGSKEMYQDLLNLGVVPNKSKIITFPDISKQYVSHFIRGYFDGDGCVTIMRGKGKYGQIILKGIAVIFTSGSKIFLEELCRKAHEIANFNIRNIYSGSGAHYLKYSTSESIEWFKFLYSKDMSDLFLKRKFEIFSAYFQLRPIKKDSIIEEMLR